MLFRSIKAMPDLPTIAQAGLPGFAATGWFSVVVRAGTPRSIVERLSGIMMSYLKRLEVQDRMQAMAIEPRTSTPEEMEQFLAAELVRWGKVVKDAGIEPQ
mgnify:CR=1 FL=1